MLKGSGRMHGTQCHLAHVEAKEECLFIIYFLRLLLLTLLKNLLAFGRQTTVYPESFVYKINLNIKTELPAPEDSSFTSTALFGSFKNNE